MNGVSMTILDCGIPSWDKVENLKVKNSTNRYYVILICLLYCIYILIIIY